MSNTNEFNDLNMCCGTLCDTAKNRQYVEALELLVAGMTLAVVQQPQSSELEDTFKAESPKYLYDVTRTVLEKYSVDISDEEVF